MIYTIHLNGKKYGIDVQESNARIMEEEPEKEKAVVREVFEEELPDFNFDNTSIISSIQSPMQGRIIAILKTKGESINKNDVLAVLESMKMEVKIIADCAGLIEQVNVSAGDFVKARQELFTIKPDINL